MTRPRYNNQSGVGNFAGNALAVLTKFESAVFTSLYSIRLSAGRMRALSPNEHHSPSCDYLVFTLVVTICLEGSQVFVWIKFDQFDHRLDPVAAENWREKFKLNRHTL